MKLFSTLPRGLIVFLGAIIVILFLILGYEFLANVTSSNGGSNTNSLFSSLFPFGNSHTSGNGNAASSSPLLQGQSGSVTELREVTANPVSGAWFTADPSSTSTPLILYMDRQSGNIFETPANSLAQTRISNTTDPGMQELYPVSDSSFIVRSFSGGKMENALATINATSTGETLGSEVLPTFDRVAVERDNSTMLMVTETSNGSVTTLSNADGSNPRTIFTSPIESWVPLLAGGRTFLETAPTAFALGYLYEVVDGGLSKIAGGLPGFTAIVSPSGRYVAYSGNTANGFSLSVLDTQTGTTYPIPPAALALKCAWIPNHEPLLLCAIPVNPPAASYPDDWLSGSVSFSDTAWIVNPLTTTAYYIGTLTDKNGVGLDAENISVDPTDSYALFMNKNDLSLWSLWIGNTVTRAIGQ